MTAAGALEAVVFDWGGTLSVHADVDMADMWRLAAKHLAPEREDEVCQALVGFEARTWAWLSEDQRTATLSQILRMANEELGLDVAEAVLEEAALHHLDSWTPLIEHDEDCRPTLRALRERGLRIGLLSNTHWPRSFHEHFLERDGLAELIDVRCYTSEMERAKPHPDAFLEVLGALGVTDPTRAVHVGDRAYDDISGCQAVGMRGVLRRNPAVPGFDVEPAATIDRLPELVPLVDAWMAG